MKFKTLIEMKKKLFYTLALNLIGTVSIAQSLVTIDYGHNASGDRIYRETIVFSGIVAGADTAEAYLLDKRVHIAPNPTTGHLVVEIEGLQPEDEGRLEVTNMQGQQLISRKEIRANNRLNLSSFASGVYFVSVVINNRRQSWRVVKE